MESFVVVVPGRMVKLIDELKEGSEAFEPMRGETVTSGGNLLAKVFFFFLLHFESFL